MTSCPFEREIVITEHARLRLDQKRQQKISEDDVIRAAASIPGYIKGRTRFRNFVARSGAFFDVVLVDRRARRYVVTLIGQEEHSKERKCFGNF